jgi:Flp pilus assembly protein TadG
MFMVTQTTRRWRDRGAAAVEFALLVGPLVMLIFGSIEFGLAVQAKTMLENSAREGVRMASLVGASDGSIATQEVKDTVTSALSSVPGLVVDPNKILVTCTPAPCVMGTAKAGTVATVKVSIQYTGVTGLIPKLPFTATSTMRIE